MTRAFEVSLTIPDNTAFTALEALRRLGIACDELRRADVYLFEVDPASAPALEPAVRTIETIFNPNKHVLRERSERPGAGEVWVTDVPPQGAPGASPKEQPMERLSIAGKTLEGVRSLRHYTAWRLRSGGSAVSGDVLTAATQRLLCNPAYQVAKAGL